MKKPTFYLCQKEKNRMKHSIVEFIKQNELWTPDIAMLKNHLFKYIEEEL
jgi:hypothetical protein